MYTIDSEDLVWVCHSVVVLEGWGCGDAAGLLEILICGAYLVNIFEYLPHSSYLFSCRVMVERSRLR